MAWCILTQPALYYMRNKTLLLGTSLLFRGPSFKSTLSSNLASSVRVIPMHTNIFVCICLFVSQALQSLKTLTMPRRRATEFIENGCRGWAHSIHCWKKGVKGAREFHKRSRNGKNRNRVPSLVTVWEHLTRTWPLPGRDSPEQEKGESSWSCLGMVSRNIINMH